MINKKYERIWIWMGNCFIYFCVAVHAILLKRTITKPRFHSIQWWWHNSIDRTLKLDDDITCCGQWVDSWKSWESRESSGVKTVIFRTRAFLTTTPTSTWLTYSVNNEVTTSVYLFMTLIDIQIVRKSITIMITTFNCLTDVTSLWLLCIQHV